MLPGSLPRLHKPSFISAVLFFSCFQHWEEKRTVAKSTHFLEVVDGEFDVERLRHGDQVQDGIGGAPQRHDGHHGVLERRAAHDVLGLQVLQ